MKSLDSKLVGCVVGGWRSNTSEKQVNMTKRIAYCTRKTLSCYWHTIPEMHMLKLIPTRHRSWHNHQVKNFKLSVFKKSADRIVLGGRDCWRGGTLNKRQAAVRGWGKSLGDIAKFKGDLMISKSE